MRRTYPLDHAFELPREDVLALVGGKAANLREMIGLGLPVPPGFVVTTETCRAFLADGWPDGLDAELRERMVAVEAAVGRGFGDASDPLLVSVRSGAPVSMPGMMDTILDLGLSDATETGLARASGSEAFARSCRERFEASFRSIVGVPTSRTIRGSSCRLAIEAVFRSWNSDRARAYRAKEGIADDLGTAVTVQAMVFGNRGATSATGVAFTRNPATGEPTLYGDVMFDAQGEDVVAGTHATEPIAGARRASAGGRRRAARARARASSTTTPTCATSSSRSRTAGSGSSRCGSASAARRPRSGSPSTWPRTRPSRCRARRRSDESRAASGRSPDDDARPDRRRDAVRDGAPASPGIASGEIATNPEAAVAAAEAGRAVILVRAETSPDDVHGMARAAGILTSRGGFASHAAVVARGWGIPAVVGAADLEVRDGKVVVGDRVLQAGDVITIDGGTGEVFEGALAGSTEVVPEAQETARVGGGARHPDRRR